MSSVYKNIIGLLKKHKVAYQEFDHKPILSYEDAECIKNQLGWEGIESKNVFMKGKDGKFYLFVTTQGNKVDFKELKDLIGVKCSIASPDDVKDIINCIPGCVAPFGFSGEIAIVLDQSIFEHTDYLFSPGVTTKTIQLNIQDLMPLFNDLPNPLTFRRRSLQKQKLRL